MHNPNTEELLKKFGYTEADPELLASYEELLTAFLNTKTRGNKLLDYTANATQNGEKEKALNAIASIRKILDEAVEAGIKRTEQSHTFFLTLRAVRFKLAMLLVKVLQVETLDELHVLQRVINEGGEGSGGEGEQDKWPDIIGG